MPQGQVSPQVQASPQQAAAPSVSVIDQAVGAPPRASSSEKVNSTTRRIGKA
jgi:hypothetical protein